MVASITGRMPTQSLCPAKLLTPVQRQAISLAVLGGANVTAMARDHSVSCKFCQQQASRARTALHQAFTPEPPDEQVLFNLPVTPAWIRQFALAQTLIGHTSGRGVLDILNCVFDYQGLSHGSLHNLLIQAAAKAQAINDMQDLSSVQVGLFDEIYQTDQPVLVGMDAASTYCFLLSLEEHCDQTTWGTRLLELSEGHGLNPRFTIADNGQGFRAGQKAAWDQKPCHGDAFHVDMEWSEIIGLLETALMRPWRPARSWSVRSDHLKGKSASKPIRS